MEAIVAEQSLMTRIFLEAKVLPLATHFAMWVLPAHRKEWAEAMLNEVAYFESKRHVLRWITGSVLSAVKARASYEMERTFMSRGILRKLLVLGSVMILTVAGLYAIQKPYQRERIRLVILQHIEGSSTQAARSGR
ncbi:hypothetical protein CH75_05920 [Dyella jiangningensis]|nr:hypothetical protein CH75_05920 [Dyella jiangningensis]